ncbi:MAG: hypothetical protein QOF61_3366 [Acidobacteriota bacterium]|jgi:hypothetical protein|nr:hypothetical protein [Acidobacteriota bacterium]
MAKCTQFSVNLAVLAPNNKRQVSFGITRGCIDDNTPFYLIIFVLRDKVDGGFQDRVKLDIRVGDTLNPKAEALMTQGLNMAQLEFLSGPLTDRAKQLKPGTTNDPKMNQLGQQLLTVNK